MTILNLDKNDDWFFILDKSNYLEGDEEILLRLTTRLREWKRDCLFDEDAGVDYALFLSNKGVLNALEGAVRDVIVNTDGIEDIIELNITVEDDRGVIIQTKVKTSFSIQNITNLLI